MAAEEDPLIRFRSTSPSQETSPVNMVTKISFIFLAVAIVIIVTQSVFVVQPGKIGIVITLGQVAAVNSGVHFRVPLVSELVYMSAQTQKLEEENVIPTKEGLSVKLDTAILFRLDATKAAEIYRQVGVDYKNLILAPEANSAIRGITAEFDAKALYSNGRNIMQTQLRDELKTKVESRGIIIEDVLLKDLVLPPELAKAIELKAQAEQDAARMEFVLQKEKQEAERKAIEAQGIADFQRIVSTGISPELLQWKGIEATEKFADSQNAKIIIVGNGSGGLPVILSAEESNGK
jgi:prohibitin 1